MTAVATYQMIQPIHMNNSVERTSEEESLVARCIAGEAAAFRELYHTHRAAVWRVTARMISDEADREEITQDIFLQIFRSMNRFKGNAKLSTWIHRIAVNVILQHIRKKKSRIVLRLVGDSKKEVESVNFDLHHATPEDHTITIERQKAVREALDKLSPKKRVVLILHDFQGMPTKEIAPIVEASQLTVRTRLFYARREFYKRLSEDGRLEDLNLAEE